MNSNIILLEDFKTPLTSMNGPSRKKINKKTLVLNDILDQTDLIHTHTHTHNILFKSCRIYIYFNPQSPEEVIWQDHMKRYR